MKLAYIDFPYEIEFRENVIQTLIIESPKIFSEQIWEFSRQYNGQDGNWVLSKQNDLKTISKIASIIIDPLSLELNQKKIITKLYDIIKEEVNFTELLVAKNEMYSYISGFMENATQNIDYKLEYNDEFELKDLFKLLNLKFSDEGGSLGEKIIDYITLANDILGTELFVFVNLKAYLDQKEFEHLFQQVCYKKIHLMLIENHECSWKHQLEEITIVDKDGCIIKQNMSL